MKTKVIGAAAVLAVATLSWAPVQAAYSQGRSGWCANSGYDVGAAAGTGPWDRPLLVWRANRLSINLAQGSLSRDRP